MKIEAPKFPNISQSKRRFLSDEIERFGRGIADLIRFEIETPVRLKLALSKNGANRTSLNFVLLDVLAIRYGMIGSLGKLTCKDNSTDYAARVHEYCQSTSRALTFLKLKIVKLEWNRLLLDEEIQNILQSCEKLFRRYRRVCRVFDLNEIHGSNVVDAYRSMLVALQRTDLTQARHVSDVVGQQVGYVKTPSLARYGIELSEVDEMIRFSGYVSLPKEFYDQQSESE